MGDLSIAESLLDGVTDALGAVGSTRQVILITDGLINDADPGAGPAQTTETISVEALLYDYEDRYVDGQAILANDRSAILSIQPLTDAQIALIKPGCQLVDGAKTYQVVNTQEIEAAGTIVTIILQIRG
jgi:hypothetical protein